MDSWFLYLPRQLRGFLKYVEWLVNFWATSPVYLGLLFAHELSKLDIIVSNETAFTNGPQYQVLFENSTEFVTFLYEYIIITLQLTHSVPSKWFELSIYYFNATSA